MIRYEKMRKIEEYNICSIASSQLELSCFGTERTINDILMYIDLHEKKDGIYLDRVLERLSKNKALVFVKGKTFLWKIVAARYNHLLKRKGQYICENDFWELLFLFYTDAFCRDLHIDPKDRDDMLRRFSEKFSFELPETAEERR